MLSFECGHRCDRILRIIYLLSMNAQTWKYQASRSRWTDDNIYVDTDSWAHDSFKVDLPSSCFLYKQFKLIAFIAEINFLQVFPSSTYYLSDTGITITECCPLGIVMLKLPQCLQLIARLQKQFISTVSRALRATGLDSCHHKCVMFCSDWHQYVLEAIQLLFIVIGRIMRPYQGEMEGVQWYYVPNWLLIDAAFAVCGDGPGGRRLFHPHPHWIKKIIPRSVDATVAWLWRSITTTFATRWVCCYRTRQKVQW